MAQSFFDCQDIPWDVYDCANPWPLCVSKEGFDVHTLENYTKAIFNACPTDHRLFWGYKGGSSPSSRLALTQEACEAVAGDSWTAHSPSIIWHRITTWKFPLMNLVLLFPTPPLGFTTKAFTLFHLLGDPVDTIANSLERISRSRDWVRYWQKPGSQHAKEDNTTRKSLAVIIDAYSEWAADAQARRVLEEAL